MESKKINQLATELTPALSDLTIIGDPTTGISKKITLSQMANLFTGTVEEYANLAAFPLVGTGDTIYIALDTNILYRWDTSLTSYVELSPNIVTSLVFSDANGFDGTISLVGSTATLTITTALTQGSVGFIGTLGALTQDNSNFFWDNTNKRLGINTNAPTTILDVFGSGIIGRLNGTSTNNSFLGFASAGTNKWSIGNVQSDHRFRIYNEATTSELVSVLQTGEFGIGIANPLTKLHIFGGASALIANLDTNTSVAKSISFRSGNSSRINLEVSGTESGSNAGADLFIRRYSDAGALIDTPLTITRSTGAISLTGALSGTSATFSGALTVTNNVTIRPTSGYNAYFQTSGTALRINYLNDALSANISASYRAIDYSFQDASGNAILSLANNGIATFSSTSSGGQNLVMKTSIAAGRNYMQFANGNGDMGYMGYGGADSKFYIVNQLNDSMLFYTNSDERMRITSGGKLVLNDTITPDALFRVNTKITTGYNPNTYNGSSANIELTNGSGSSGAFSAIRFTGGGSTEGLFGVVQDSSTFANFIWQTYNGSVYRERMRLNPDGVLRVEGNTMGFSIGQVSGENRIQYNGSSFVLLNTGNGFTAIAASAFNVNSDYRLKEDLKPFNNSLDILNKIKIYDFKWKANNERNYGVIAHELQEVLPYIVYGEKDGMEENGDIRTQGVDYGKIVPILVKGIQELQQQIEELKALINK